MTPAAAGRWRVANLIAQLAFGLVAMTICLPSMPSWVDRFGASTAAVQLTFSAYVLAFGLLQLVYGPLSDRLGRRRVLLAGLAVAGAGSLAAVFAPDLPTLVAARALQGAGTAAGMVVGRALVQDLFQGAERTRVMAFVGMAMGLCPPTAILLGGQLHVRLGWQANFALVAGLAALLAVAAWRGLPAESARPGMSAPVHWARAMAQAYARLARERNFVLYVCILAMATATFYAFLAGAPLVLGGLGVGPERMGLYIMAIPLSYIGGNYLATRLAQAVGDRALMRWGQGLSMAGLLLLLALAGSGLHTALAFAAPLVLLGIGHGLLMPPTLSGTVGVIPALAGSAAAVGGLMQQLLGAVGGYAVGWVHHDSAFGVGALMLGFMLLALLAQVALHRAPAGAPASRGAGAEP
jgi:DHA1 family bicyclomycin/chloramphenicol resistance-like MFS transporter